MLLFKELKSLFKRRYKNWSADVALRYLPILDVLKEGNFASILEVGSGSLGITPYLKKLVVGADLNFNGPKTNLVKKVFASATKLPFKKNSFDCVICVDALEHIKPKLRKRVIKELLRLGKRNIIIGFPCGDKAVKEDLYFKKLFLKIMKKEDPFLNDHIKNGLPDRNEIFNLLREENKVKAFDNVNISLHHYILLTQISKKKILNFISGVVNIILLPIFSKFNFGDCYRVIFIVNKRK